MLGSIDQLTTDSTDSFDATTAFISSNPENNTEYLMNKQSNISSDQQQNKQDSNTALNETLIDTSFSTDVDKLNSSLRVNEDNLLEWSNITVLGPKPKRKPFSKQLRRRNMILENISGSAKPYCMTALMGASGAGKSTLLNILSMSISSQLKAYGKLKFNGETTNIRNIASYVPQTDLFFARLTVVEHLKFNIEMYYGNSISSKEKKELLNEISSRTNLIRCYNTQIGDPLKGIGISGGERRRLSLASELIRRPKILFADEPTSGLDNFMAVTVVNLLNELSNEGIIVICVIHQPSSQIFSAFGQVYLLAEGRNVFGGSLDLCRDIFSKAQLHCPANFNPADYYIEMIAISPENEEYCRKRIELIKESCKTNHHQEDVKDSDIAANMSKANRLRNIPPKFLTQKYPTSNWKQFIELIKRRIKTVGREPLVSYIRIAQTILIAIIIGLIYLQLEYKLSNNQSFLGVLFFIATNNSFMNLFMVINTFPIELNIYRKEHNNRMYRTLIYYIQVTLLDFPMSFLTTILSTSISYWMIGLYPSAQAFFYHLLVVYLIVLCASSYGYFISAIANTPVTASIISAPLMLPLLIFGGFFIKQDQIPIYFIWIEYISWFKYGFELLALIQYKDISLECDDLLICTDPGITKIDGQVIIKNFGFSYDNFNIDIIALVMIFILFRLLSVTIIILKTYLHEK